MKPYDKVRFRIERSGMKPQTVYRAVDPGVGETSKFAESIARYEVAGREITVTVEYRLRYPWTDVSKTTVEWLPARTETWTVVDGKPHSAVVAPCAGLTAAVEHARSAVLTAQQVHTDLTELLVAEPRCPCHSHDVRSGVGYSADHRCTPLCTHSIPECVEDQHG